MTFQQIILALQRFWSKQGCVLGETYDVEKGAGTMNPATFLRTIGPASSVPGDYETVPEQYPGDLSRILEGTRHRSGRT